MLGAAGMSILFGAYMGIAMLVIAKNIHIAWNVYTEDGGRPSFTVSFNVASAVVILVSFAVVGFYLARLIIFSH